MNNVPKFVDIKTIIVNLLKEDKKIPLPWPAAEPAELHLCRVVETAEAL